VGPKVFTSPEIEIVVAIWSFTASSGDALAVLAVHTLHLFHELVNGKHSRGLGMAAAPGAQPGGGGVVQGAATGRDDEAVRRFIERFALDLADAGMPRMPARVFAAILSAEDGRCTAAELAQLLRVSPAAVSGAVRYLLQVRLVRREREPGERRDHYRISSDTWYEAITRREAVVARWEQDLEEGIKAVGPHTPAADRLEETRQFLAFTREQLARVLHDWRQRRSAP
jgi:DNA-binding transcriptional regulator GbsR (MarR family)